MHSDYKRSARIAAPVQMVWDEMNDLDAILAKSTQFVSYDLAADGRSAQIKGNLTWGPLKYAVDGRVSLDESIARELTRYVMTVPQLGLRYTGAMRITPGSATETTLDYNGDLEIEHKMAGRMRGLFNDLLEEHIHGLTTRVKARAEQRRLADERLLQ